MKQTVTVIGLGYVGFPLSLAIAKSGKYKVFGLTRNSKNIHSIKNKLAPIDNITASLDIDKLDLTVTSKAQECLPISDFIVICVPTPVNKDHTPDLFPIVTTSKLIAKFLRPNQVIILESSVNPGVCEEVILPILETSGLAGGIDFELSHCPERINPGDPKWNVYNIARNVGSLTKKGNGITANFYRSFLKARVYEMGNLKEAESTKILENTFRDVNIALVNELAQSFDKMGINLLNVIKGAANKPFAFMVHYPGCGVGGHCIPVDPYYLIQKAKEIGFEQKLMKTARQINNNMPKYTVNLLLKALGKSHINLKDIKVGILGVTYKPDVADTRESPAITVLEILKDKGINVEIFDPFIQSISTVKNLEEILKQCKAIILCTAHKSFVTNLTSEKLTEYKTKILIDGRNCLDSKSLSQAGIYYKGIGF
ncbi:hypothetical protein A3D03_05180 [Candidatus Gottesmanbacteria bacterium RIFCSPHIGHO2_02_FULL_40_13]|uniref:UDP-glucose/GDP-mannose dehydrogenase C-terminal domain-containing protein n=1 Tax=Candidatus Gottesmanbacteria bacterium RIFCSPHIGHO2_02_FULL_40_13 TaxID=1798384 RepID=A0A1F6A942_9BACT|nr:MAG: hypothetical protein A3D03_05180 [Candidatus Gottesmanbacteria bacterium RIFCSPHIGHO2_02_FULL_40_13]